MNRRAFIQGLIGLASMPMIAKYINVFKPAAVREGITQAADNTMQKGIEFYEAVIKRVMDEGTVVSESNRIRTYKHPDKPDIDVEIDLGTGDTNVNFESDYGFKAGAEITTDIEAGPASKELMEGELVYRGTSPEGDYTKDWEEGIIEGGITNLENWMKRKRGYAAGGRVGMFRGGIPKGLAAALRAIRSKFGDDAITTADKAPQPEKTIQEEIMDFNARNPNPNRQMTDEEITEFADEFGLDPSEDYYNWDGTLADAKRLLKEAEDEKKYMYQQYKAGRLDPKPGEKGREKFLEKKLEEAELSGESKLITRDEIQELEDLRITREMAPQMTERLELKARYPGITDDLLDSILIDDNPQRKAEVLATLDEAFAMMKKGKGPDEILRIIKNINRTKQADGGSIDGDVSLTVIKIPDISESGVESLFKRR